MKKYLILAAFALATISCKDSGLHNSFIYFSEAQPTNVDEIKVFPKKFVRTYTLDYSHRLVIQPKCAYVKEIETITALKKVLTKHLLKTLRRSSKKQARKSNSSNLGWGLSPRFGRSQTRYQLRTVIWFAF